MIYVEQKCMKNRKLIFIPTSKTAARVKYPAALQRCKFDTPLLAAGSLIIGEKEQKPVVLKWKWCIGRMADTTAFGQ